MSKPLILILIFNLGESIYMEKQHNYDSNNILTIGGASTLQLVKKFGSPLCVIDEDSFRQKCKLFNDFAHEVYPNSQVCYTSSALCCKAIYKILKEYPNMGCNVVSSGQILTAKSTNFDSTKIYFNGSNKLHSEIDLALKNGIFNSYTVVCHYENGAWVVCEDCTNFK